jgi:multidrug efflux pump
MNSSFNLSAWALAHRTLILFLIVMSAAIGTMAYLRLGRAEDPSFTIKTMTIRTEWPGATAAEVERLVTDPIEKKVEELAWYDYAKSYSKPGESVVFVNLKDSTPPAAVAEQWYQTRKKIADIAGTLPQGAQGPYFNDEFGDVYSAVYAVMGADFTPDQLKKIAEEARERLLKLPAVEKVDLVGVQDQKIYIEASNQRLASFGLSVDSIIQAVQHGNSLAAAGVVDAGSDRIFVRVEDGLDDAAAVRALPIAINGRQVRLGDVAEVRRGYTDPQSYTMRFMGRDAIGLGVVMTKGGNVLALGRSLDAELMRIKAALPAGIDVAEVANQSHIVTQSIGEFQESLFEALAIVMAVTLVSLGWRTGIVVALTVPLVLALTMAGMLMLGIDLQRVSSGALIIALGLLVDDAIIAVEMMMVKIEQGWDRLKAGAFAYRSTAFPMLTGTVVTAAGFVPVGLAQSAVAEYTGSIFRVVALALLVSWLVAVLFTPYLGYYLLPKPKHRVAAGAVQELYDTRIYRLLRRAIATAVGHRWWTLGATAGLLALAIIGFGLVPQQFFPTSDRPELLVDMTLAEGSSFAATSAEVAKMEKLLAADPDVDHFVAYTGGGSPRFYLALDVQLNNSNFAQFVVVTKGIEARKAVKRRLESRLDGDFPATRIRVSALENGPPVGYPVQFRVTGGDAKEIRSIAYRLRDIMRANPGLANVTLEWDELSKRVRVELDPAKAEALGVSKQALSQALDLMLEGQAVTQYREGTELIDVVLRVPPAERLDLSRIGELDVPTASGGVVPLSQVATLHYDLEEPILWRRSRDTALTVEADVLGKLQGPVATAEVEAAIHDLRQSLPDGYRITAGGAAEESGKGQNAINAMMPVMLLIMLTALMLQLQSFSRVALVLLTAPLGIIGVSAALLITGSPFGFVALLGVIALAGIIMRNSVILVDQIDQDIRAGHDAWTAILDATVRRARPILLTAVAAILGMLPLASSVFWGPMAIAIMGGLTAATGLTLFVLPALYAAWFRVRQPVREAAQPAGRRLRFGGPAAQGL